MVSRRSEIPPGGAAPLAEPAVGKRCLVQINAAVFLFSLALHCNTLAGDFVYDDERGVVKNPDVVSANGVLSPFRNDFWGSVPHWPRFHLKICTNPMTSYGTHKSYRPITVLLYKLEHHLFGLNPAYFHATNVLLHALVCVLFTTLLAKWFATAEAAAVGGLLFAAHPIHTEAVASIVGRAEVLCGVFYLCGLLLYCNHAMGPNTGGASAPAQKQRWGWLLPFSFLALCAMLAKEQGITVVGAALAFELVAVSATPPAGWLGILAPSRRPRPMWVKRTRLRLVFLSMLGLALLMLRVLVMGGERPKFNRQELPHKFHPDRWVRMLSLHHLVGFNAGLLLAPMTLCHDWAYGSIPLVERWQDPRLLPTAGVYGLALLLLVGTAKAPMRPKGLSCSGLLLLGAALTAVPFLPSANLFFDVGFVVAERVLYLPSMGFVWLLVAALGWLKRRAGRPACSAVVMLLLALYSSKTLRRNREWTSNYSIHQAGYRDNPNNVKLVGNWGSLRWSDCVKHRALPGNDRRACVAEAEPYLRQALQMDPTHLPPALLLGKLLRYAGRQREATAVLEAALQHDDNTAIPSQIGLELGQLYEGAGQSQRAEDAYVAALNRHERFYEGYIALARFLAKGKRWTDCQRMYRAALALRPKSAETYHELGLAQNEWGRTADAIQSFALAAQLDPRHPHAAKNRDVLLAHMREKRG